MNIQTPSQTVGPFFHYGLVLGGENILTNEQTRGQRIRITGTVFDGAGQGVPDALIEIWQADANGFHNHPADPHHAQADPHFRGFGRSPTVNAGQFSFDTVKPGRVEGQAPHVNVRVFSRGMLVHAVTRMYFGDEAANTDDALLNSIDAERRATLIAQPIPYELYRFDIHLQGDSETVFFTP